MRRRELIVSIGGAAVGRPLKVLAEGADNSVHLLMHNSSFPMW
jgi:hypothetical protein